MWVSNADGSNAHSITPDTAGAFPGTFSTHIWSPDSQNIVYMDTGTAGAINIWTVNVNTGVTQQLTTGAYTDMEPNWSADGEKIVFSSNRDGVLADIYVMSKTGTNLTNLTNTPTIRENYPVWEGKVVPLTYMVNGVNYTEVESGDNFASQSFTVPDDAVFINNGRTGSVTVQGGGTLKGTGQNDSVIVQNGGHLAPGMSPGCMTSTSLSFAPGSAYDFELGGTVVCSQYDQMRVSGSVSLGGSTLNVALVNNFNPSPGQTFTILDKQGAGTVSGTFAGLPEGSTFQSSGVTYRISYQGGDGNDVVLTVVSAEAAPGVPKTGMQRMRIWIPALISVLVGAWLIVRAQRFVYYRLHR
jgi:hypothetical protein